MLSRSHEKKSVLLSVTSGRRCWAGSARGMRQGVGGGRAARHGLGAAARLPRPGPLPPSRPRCHSILSPTLPSHSLSPVSPVTHPRSRHSLVTSGEMPPPKHLSPPRSPRSAPWPARASRRARARRCEAKIGGGRNPRGAHRARSEASTAPAPAPAPSPPLPSFLPLSLPPSPPSVLQHVPCCTHVP